MCAILCKLAHEDYRIDAFLSKLVYYGVRVIRQKLGGYMKDNKILLCAMAFIAALFVQSQSWAAQTTDSNKAKALINRATEGKVTVVQEFDAGNNLVGFVVKPKEQAGQQAIIYADKNGKYLLVGALIDAQGNNRTDLDTQKYIQSKVAKQAFKAANNTAWVQDGKSDAKHMMYVVGDPNCVYCHKFYQVTRPFVKSGDLAIRWIWVGYLKPSSAGMAAAILNAKDPAKLLAKNESGFSDRSEQGGIKPLKNPPQAALDKLQKNMDFMSKFQFPGTPVLIYMDQSGQPKTMYGVPQGEDLKKVVEQAQKIKS